MINNLKKSNGQKLHIKMSKHRRERERQTTLIKREVLERDTVSDRERARLRSGVYLDPELAWGGETPVLDRARGPRSSL